MSPRTKLTWATTAIWRAKGEVDVLLAVQTDDVTGDVNHLLPDSAHTTLFCLVTGLCTKQCNRNKRFTQKFTGITGPSSPLPSKACTTYCCEVGQLPNVWNLVSGKPPKYIKWYTCFCCSSPQQLPSIMIYKLKVKTRANCLYKPLFWNGRENAPPFSETKTSTFCLYNFTWKPWGTQNVPWGALGT